MKKGIDALTQAVVTGAIVPTNEAQRRELEQAKHTPGPWEANGVRILNADRSAHIALVSNSASILKWQCTPASFENAANARLIAAAPCMLKALTELVASLDWEENRSGTTYNGIEAARAEIAKAGGAK